VIMSFHPTRERPTEYGQSRKEREESLRCQREHRDHWVVVMREGNASAFNGYHWTPSDYSLVRCTVPGCQRPSWRTKAAYVRDLPDAE